MKKFNFVEFVQKPKSGDDTGLTVSINKALSISFGVKIREAHNSENKFIKFYSDTEKGAVGWRYFSESNLEGLKDLRLMKPNSGKNAILSISKIMKQFPVLPANMSKLPVHLYKGDSFTEELYYVELKPNIEHE
jgi:hypothetical protein